MKGANAARGVNDQCHQLGLRLFTLYALSDENWGRPMDEMSFLMVMLSNE